MSSAVSSKRYAQAIFQIARQKNDFEDWQKSLQKISAVMQDLTFASIMENPRLHFEQKTRLIKEMLGTINPLALNLAYLLVLKGRVRNAVQVADEYESLLDEYRGIKRADIITPIEINDTEKQQFREQLEKLTKSKLRMYFQVDPGLLGGFIARIDGTLIDGSVRNRLNLLKKNISTASK